MHDAACERAVSAGPQQDLDVGLLHGLVIVDVDRRDLGATLFAGARGVRHHIDLGVDGIGAPDHDEIGNRHLARVGAGDLACAGRKADAGDGGANGAVEARIFLHMGQTVNAVLHHQSHGSSIVIRPDRFGAEFALRLIETVGDFVQRVVPGDAGELARSFRAGPELRIGHAFRMMNALGITGDLGADHAGRVGLLLRAAHAPDRRIIDHLDIERACRRAIMRTGRVPNFDSGMLVHDRTVNIKRRTR